MNQIKQRVYKVDFTKKEIMTLARYCDVKRNEDERNMRRIRRNLSLIQERYDSMPKYIIEQDGILSPAEELDMLSKSKAEAVVLKKKLRMQINFDK